MLNLINRRSLSGLIIGSVLWHVSMNLAASFNGALALDPDETITVTAQRRASAVNETLARVSVITREDIERTQASDLQALLETEAGISMARSGPLGAQTSLFMRGTNSNHVLVLIDGIRVAGANSGVFQWELIDLATVERIEIVRGPRAARWGSDAIGGVIQIFTRQAKGLSLGASVGSYGERGGRLAFGRDGHSITGAATHIGGFSAQNPNGFAYDPDRDGFENQQLAVRGKLVLPHGHLNWVGRWLSGETEFDQGISDVKQTAGHIGYQLDLTNGRWSIDAGHYRDDLETSTPFGLSHNITRRTHVNSVFETTISDQTTWMLGADLSRERGINQGVWKDTRDHWGLWTGLDGQLDQMSYSISLRVDDDERYGQETTGQMALGWSIGDDWRWYASLGEGFRSPQFNQLFSPGFGGLFAGNPNLQPETSTSLETGLDWKMDDIHRWSISAFQTDIKGLINFSGVNFQAINIDEATIKGVELTHQFGVGQWQGGFQWTWQDPRDVQQNQPLLRRPKSKGSAVVSYDWGVHQLSGEIIYFGQRLDIGQMPLSAYTLINVSGRISISPDWSLQGRLVNLAGQAYEPLIGFNGQGRSVHFTLLWKPSQ